MELVKVYTITDALPDYEPNKIFILYSCFLFYLKIIINCVFISPSAPYEDIHNLPGKGSEQSYLCGP